jgi:DNA-binding beta-propeller fold protein YncE
MTAVASTWTFACAAPAATGHRLVEAIGEAPPGTALGEPTSVAVERASGRTFVTDPARGVVDVVSGSGSFETQFDTGTEAGGVAIDEATGDVYVAAPMEDAVLVFKRNGEGEYEQISQWTGAGTPDGAFGEVADVAVDNSSSGSDPHAGDVYVVDAGDSAVDVFEPKPAGPEEAQEGGYVEMLAGGALEAPNGAAVDTATGQVLVADSVKGFVAVYSGAGRFERKLTGAGSPDGKFFGPGEEEGNVAAVAVDPASGHVYVAEAERRVVSEFDSEGDWLGWITGPGTSGFGEPRGVALAASGDVYVTDAAGHELDVFGPDLLVADAKTTPASRVTKTTAGLNGVVNADGLPTSYRFQWGESGALGQETASRGAGSGEEAVSAELTELKAGRPYFFRVVAEDEDGVSYGAIQEFQTRPAVEGVSTGSPENVMPAEATLTGSLDPAGVETRYFFQWGKTASYGATSPQPPANAGSAKEPVEVKTTLSGLSPNTTYHYRVVGEDEYGITYGEDAQFTTSGPPLISNEATTGIEHYAATIHARIDPGELETEYRFQYGETTAYGSEAPIGGGKIPAGASSVAESAALSGLRIGTVYHFRVIATNAAGTTVGPDQTFTTVAPAVIEAEQAAEVSASEATLQTQIDPLGHETTYTFQYGTGACASDPTGCVTTPSPAAAVGSGEAGVAESVRLGGLSPSTTYHYRVLASNSLGTAEGVERAFTTQASPGPLALPDGRAWEMVTPPDKHGAPIEALTREGGLIRAAEDGDSLAYLADGAIEEQPEGNRSPEMQQVLAQRTSEGWVSKDLATPNSSPAGYELGEPQEYQFFTPDLSLALVEPYGVTPFSEPPLAPEATQKTIYIRDDATGSFLPLVTEANVPPGTRFGKKIHFLSATPDLSHVLLRSEVALTAPPSGPGLYEWSEGKLQLVSVLPGGDTPAPAASLGFEGHVLANALSSDGTHVIWTGTAQGGGAGHLYMRDTALGQTIQLDAAQGVAEPPGAGSARFQTASTDGSRVFFTDPQRLTPDSTAQPAPEAADLYECEITETEGKLGCQLKDLTADNREGEHAAVQGFVFGASEDGTSLYFVAHGALAENENGNRESAQPGEENLYELQFDGAQWSTSFIATLSSEDRPEWEGGGEANSSFLTARVSPDGRYLAFMSAASPTGYDNLDASAAANGAHDEEVYLYDSATATLTCASCNPSGARPDGVLDTEDAGEGRGLLVDRRKVWIGHWLAGNIPGWTSQSLVNALFQPRYLNDEGRLFFNSPDRLVPAGADGKENVYEYEPTGLGSCESPSGGCVALISGGSSDRESAFVEATPSGDDAYFITAAQLLPQDTDTAFDIYDARVCTAASPCLTPPSPTGLGCESTGTCRPAQAPQQAPIEPAGSASASAEGSTVSGQPSSSRASSGELGTKAGKPKPLTRAQQLAEALEQCKRLDHANKLRRCEASAKHRYGAKHKKYGAKHKTYGPKHKTYGAKHKTYGPKHRARRSSTTGQVGRRGA